MSSVTPTSLKAGPTTTNTLVKKRYLIFHVLIIWLSLIPLFFGGIQLVNLYEFTPIFIFLIFPLVIILSYELFLFSSIFWAWLFLKIASWIHSPQEGVFPRDPNNIDYRFWSLRAVIKKFPIWVSHNSPIPWFDTLIFRIFGNNVAPKTPLFDAWVDSEFLELGHGTIIGQGSVIMTSMITTEFLIIKRVIIGKDCLVGAHAVVSPGTVFGNNVVLGALSNTNFGQQLEANWVYWGTPAQKFHPAKFREEDDLTSEERAKTRQFKEVTAEVADSAELDGRKSARASYQRYKSGLKEKRASKHEDKARLKRFRGEYKARKSELRAERHELKAERQRFEAEIALDKAQQAILAKIEKQQAKLAKTQDRDAQKALKRELRSDKKHLRILGRLKQGVSKKEIIINTDLEEPDDLASDPIILDEE